MLAARTRQSALVGASARTLGIVGIVGIVSGALGLVVAAFSLRKRA